MTKKIPNYQLWAAIRQAGMNQEQFAKKVGCSGNTVSAVINRSVRPSRLVKLRMCEVLGMDEELLFDYLLDYGLHEKIPPRPEV